MSGALEAQRWSQLQSLFEEAVGLEPRAREALLRSVLAKDPPLWGELAGMLEADVAEGPLDADPTLLWSRGGKPGPQAARRFLPGDRVAGRFVVVALLGAGGMGEVYEAVDEELGERVAIKTLRAGPQNASAVDRLRREVRLARRIAHPSVCRVFEVYTHCDAVGDAAGLLVASMELLRGETLEARLRRGRLRPAEALAVARQVAEGLEAAHRGGVVHRDLKAGNVVLVDGDPGRRVVITDFGLAVRPAPEPGELGNPTITRSGTIVGTPSSLAPEQLTGGRVTPATDIYAFGILLYEMVTGRPPFTGGTTFEQAMRRLAEEPPSPRLIAADLPRRWERTILRCLEREPKRRFGGAAEVIQALEPPPNRYLLPAAVGLVLASLATGVLLGRNVPSPDGEPQNVRSGVSVAPFPATRRVAVLPPRNLARRSESDWMATALAEMLTLELAGDGLAALPTEEVATMERELAIGAAVTLGRDTLAGVRRYLDCDLAVLGGFFAAGDAEGRLRLDLWVESLAPPGTIGSFSVSATEDTMLDLVAQAGDRLRQLLAAEGDLRTGDDLGLPRSRQAARLYSLGVLAYRRHDAAEARDLFAEALQLEPDAAILEVSLADAWEALGHDGESVAAARRAAALAHRLPDRQRWLVEGRLSESVRDWEGAVASYRRLVAASPGDTDAVLRLAAALARNGRGAEALKHLSAVPGGSDGRHPRLDLAMAAVQESIGDHRGALEAAQRASEVGGMLGARRLVALAELRKAGACWRLGRLEEARRAAERAGTHFAEIGDRAAEAGVLNLRGNIAENLGQRTAARRFYEAALLRYRELDHRRGTMIEHNNLGLLDSQAGEMAAARRHHEEALKIGLEIGHREGVATQLHNLGVLAQTEGSYARAERFYERAEAAAAEIGLRDLEMVAINGRGEVAAEQGQLESAGELLRRALALSQQLDLVAAQAEVWIDLGVVQRRRGELTEAMASHRRALEMGQQLDNPWTTATASMLLAEELRLAGRWRESAKLLGEARDLHRGLEDPAGLAEVHLAGVRLSCDQRDLAAARRSSEALRSLVARGGDSTLTALVAWADAVLAAAEGRWSEARHLAESAANRLASPGLALGRYAATALAAEASLRCGDSAAARRQLDSLPSPGSLDLGTELEWQLTRLRLDADPSAAKELARRARRRGYLPLALAADLLAAQAVPAEARATVLEQIRHEATTIEARALIAELEQLRRDG